MICRPAAWVFRHRVLVASRRCPTSRASTKNRSAPCRWKGGGAWGSIALTNLVKIAALVADLAATS